MNIYELSRDRPEWVDEPATNRQIKVIKFFKVCDEFDDLTKGIASALVCGVFADPDNRVLWNKYVYFTNDTGSENSDLKPYDIDLRSVELPSDWKSSKSHKKDSWKVHMGQALDILSEGTPYDVPVPKIQFTDSYFAFTGKFKCGTRNQCIEITNEHNGIGQQRVTLDTDFLVIGDDGSNAWSHSKGGQKIQQAIVYRMENEKPKIITEGDWIGAIQDSNDH